MDLFCRANGNHKVLFRHINSTLIEKIESMKVYKKDN